jgi:urease subunit gamma/beta
MRLTPTERDRLLLFSAAELARSRRRRGLKLNVPESIALIADTVAEAARDGARLLAAAEAGRSVLTTSEVLDGVPSIVTEVKVEAVFDDGTRLVVVRDPFRLDANALAPSTSQTSQTSQTSLTSDEPGGVTPAIRESTEPDAPHAETVQLVELLVTNTADVPISITSHFHFFEVNPRLSFDRNASYGMRLDIPAGSAQRFDPSQPTYVRLVPIGGARVAIGFAGLVDGELDAPGQRQ